MAIDRRATPQALGPGAWTEAGREGPGPGAEPPRRRRPESGSRRLLPGGRLSGSSPDLRRLSHCIPARPAEDERRRRLLLLGSRALGVRGLCTCLSSWAQSLLLSPWRLEAFTFNPPHFPVHSLLIFWSVRDPVGGLGPAIDLPPSGRWAAGCLRSWGGLRGLHGNGLSGVSA